METRTHPSLIGTLHILHCPGKHDPVGDLQFLRHPAHICLQLTVTDEQQCRILPPAAERCKDTEYLFMILRRRKMSDMANHKPPIEPIGRTHFAAHLRSKSEAITVDPVR